MKNLFYLLLCLLFVACNETQQEKLGKKIIGEWCNPYTYQSTGELKGFNFKKGGKCEAINVPTLQLKSWEIEEGGYLIIKGIDIAKDGTTSPYETRERIATLNQDTLCLVSREETPRIAFIYLNKKVIEQRITPEQQKLSEKPAEETTVE